MGLNLTARVRPNMAVHGVVRYRGEIDEIGLVGLEAKPARRAIGHTKPLTVTWANYLQVRDLESGV